MTIKNIHNHVAFSSHAKIRALCKPLFQNSAVTYFCFQRFYPNNDYTFLASQPHLGEFFYVDGVYKQSWLMGVNYQSLQSGYLPWNLCREMSDPQQQAASEIIQKELGLNQGIDVVHRYPTHCDSYSFASTSLDIHLCSTAFLERFILYFKQMARHLIAQAGAERFHLPRELKSTNLPILGGDQLPHQDPFAIQRYYLEGEHSDVYLTQKELDCLRAISRGFTAKETAKALGISHRTVEAHTKNIKEKLGVSRITEAVRHSVLNHILTYD